MAYSILFKQCGSDHMTRGRSRVIDRIVVHFTATLASARNNATYFARNEGQGASAHYFVDDITPEIYQSVAEGDTAWHAGDWQMNCRAIGIEVVSAGEDFSATEVEKLGWLVRKLMARYGIGASGVIRHYDVTGKLCPAPYVAASKRAALKAAITGGGSSGGTTSAAPDGTVPELARRVIAGEFGNGDARRCVSSSSFEQSVKDGLTLTKRRIPSDHLDAPGALERPKPLHVRIAVYPSHHQLLLGFETRIYLKFQNREGNMRKGASARKQEPTLNTVRRTGTLRSRRESRRVARSASSILAGARNWGGLDQLSPLMVSSSSAI